ncbi:MAG TPA: hypothetical protein VFI90_15750, partial [Rubrobacter sp.]|nr:hypothetical protein [Rubrobacter sp.]
TTNPCGGMSFCQSTATPSLAHSLAHAINTSLGAGLRPPRFCPECGAAPEKVDEHCPPPRKRRLAEGEGETVTLPPASGASELFDGALERFRADITHLPHRREDLRGERFSVRREWVTGFEVSSGKTPVMRRYLREATDTDSWLIFFEERGVDPKVESFDEPADAVITPAGAAPVPPEPLTRLVGPTRLREIQSSH